MSRSMSRRQCLALFGAASTGSPIAWAQPSWPAAKPLTVTVGLQAGTGSDVAMRNLADKVAGALGQQLVINNLPGAAGLLAAQHGGKAQADGYSLVALSGAAVTTLPHLQKGQNPAR